MPITPPSAYFKDFGDRSCVRGGPSPKVFRDFKGEKKQSQHEFHEFYVFYINSPYDQVIHSKNDGPIPFTRKIKFSGVKPIRFNLRGPKISKPEKINLADQAQI